MCNVCVFCRFLLYYEFLTRRIDDKVDESWAGDKINEWNIECSQADVLAIPADYW